ncbi:hypothetical protein QUB29_22780, partial [Microcoleus sp. B4b_D2]|uniref:hypothetical protein n=1 Tax=unclassified Microcoleus TaxID=2642155 RepID=UPI002FD075B1
NCGMILIALWDGRPARPVYFHSRRDTPQESFSNCCATRALHNCGMILIALWDGRPARPVYFHSRRDG